MHLMGFTSPWIISSLYGLSPSVYVVGVDGWDSESSIDDVPVSRFGGTLPGTLIQQPLVGRILNMARAHCTQTYDCVGFWRSCTVQFVVWAQGKVTYPLFLVSVSSSVALRAPSQLGDCKCGGRRGGVDRAAAARRWVFERLRKANFDRVTYSIGLQ